jgi:signal peptidase II
MKAKLKTVFIIALVILVLDHITKGLVVAYIPLGGRIPVIPNIFDLVHARNTGAAFGFLDDWNSPLKDWFFYIVALIAMVFLYFYVKSIEASDKLSLFALSFIFGGALGNVGDRLFRGSVVDFLSVHYHNQVVDWNIFGWYLKFPLIWPAFNVADMAISSAIVLLIWQSFRGSNNDMGLRKKLIEGD